MGFGRTYIDSFTTFCSLAIIPHAALYLDWWFHDRYVAFGRRRDRLVLVVRFSLPLHLLYTFFWPSSASLSTPSHISVLRLLDFIFFTLHLSFFSLPFHCSGKILSSLMLRWHVVSLLGRLRQIYWRVRENGWPYVWFSQIASLSTRRAVRCKVLGPTWFSPVCLAANVPRIGNVGNGSLSDLVVGTCLICGGARMGVVRLLGSANRFTMRGHTCVSKRLGTSSKIKTFWSDWKLFYLHRDRKILSKWKVSTVHTPAFTLSWPSVITAKTRVIILHFKDCKRLFCGLMQRQDVPCSSIGKDCFVVLYPECQTGLEGAGACSELSVRTHLLLVYNSNIIVDNHPGACICSVECHRSWVRSYSAGRLFSAAEKTRQLAPMCWPSNASGSCRALFLTGSDVIHGI